ncbi:proline synthetase co-transcribed protein, putative [Eimeria necatrix]|uniref:Pyridoxal phosphate homeostasis protein n=1 Tax=Eimeria necatrix TaxID=51315 RepID=U6MH31_9EIME|nr:proline synthetase co-transcribed protein, putative [Eimeria necatrix]CDJ62378.1 proline synthetase co-transcribed protein, putative [Eimeria necatrix]
MAASLRAAAAAAAAASAVAASTAATAANAATAATAATAAAEAADKYAYVVQQLTEAKQSLEAAAAAAAAASGTAAAAKAPLLIAVSKTHPPAAVAAAAATGHRHFGENYVAELVEKAQKLPEDYQWHLIGNLQTNKVKALVTGVRNLYSVDSVDSVKLAEVLQRETEKANKQLNVLVQVNAGGEPQKHGVRGDDWNSTKHLSLSLVYFILDKCPNLKFRGFMTVAPQGVDEAILAFKRMKELKEEAARDEKIAAALNGEDLELSMGMSRDMQTAVQNGSTQVRIGTAIFGARGPPKV